MIEGVGELGLELFASQGVPNLGLAQAQTENMARGPVRSRLARTDSEAPFADTAKIVVWSIIVRRCDFTARLQSLVVSR
jgi:hypothetical protein